MRQHFIGGAARAGRRRRPKETRRVTGFGHVGCGGAVVAVTNEYGTTHHCLTCRRPTTPVGGNPAPWPDDAEPF